MIDINKYDYDKTENEMIKKNIFTYIKAEQEIPVEKKKRKEKEKENNTIKSMKLKLDSSNKKELNNSFANSNLKKPIKLRNKKNEIEQKISLATKKLNDILLKKNDFENNNRNKEKQKLERRSMTDEEFFRGYSKLDNVLKINHLYENNEEPLDKNYQEKKCNINSEEKENKCSQDSKDNIDNNIILNKTDNKQKSNRLISLEYKDEFKNEKYYKTNFNFYNKLNKNKQINNTSENNENIGINDKTFTTKNGDISQIKKTHTVTHKKKSRSRKKSKSIEKGIIIPRKSLDKIETEEEKKIKEEIKSDFENYFEFLSQKGIKKKEDIYDSLNDSYEWKVIDELIMEKGIKLEEIITIFINLIRNKNDMNNNDIFAGNEYIKTIIEYYSKNLSRNQKEILHLNMIEIYLDIDEYVDNKDNTSVNMYEFMGDLLYILLKNKLYYMKDLNNFIDKGQETQINIAKVVYYSIIASGNSSKQYHNDFKFTKLFNNNDIFTIYVTNQL